MAKLTSYYKIVQPKPSVTKVTDNQQLGDQGAYGNFSWYQRLVQGSASRLTRYREYDLMDSDVEVARALDTIAEEMTGNNPKTDEPLMVVVDAEKEEKIENVTILTLKAALKYWVQNHDWENRLFKVSRTMIKYGDCFFRKSIADPRKKWQYLHAKNIVGGLVDKEDVTKVLGWQIKTNTNKVKSSYGVPVTQSSSDVETELVDANEIVRFTLNDDMSDGAPFGDSVLGPVYRAHKQKELLEDAIIIYRIQRAPERRVFKIDVGKMPPHRVKTYLEQIKNEIKQKKVPNIHGGQQEVDSVYNPQSMCLALDTKIPLLDGRTLTLEEIIKEYEEGKNLWVYSINPDTGEIVPGPISWAGVTRKNAETVKLTLDNGEEIVCTPDHKIPVQGKGFIQAKDLTPEDSLWPFHKENDYISNKDKKTSSKYTKIYNPASKGWIFAHRMVANYMKSINEHNEWCYNERFSYYPKRTIHHKSFCSLDNNPENLVWMNALDHTIFHKSLDINQEIYFSNEMFAIFENLVEPDIKTVKFKEVLNRISTDEKFMRLYKKENLPIKKTSKIKTDRIRQKMFLKFMKNFGYKNWKEYQQKKIQEQISVNNSIDNKAYSENEVKLIQLLIELVKNISIHNFALVNYLKENSSIWNKFVTLYEKTKDISKPGQYQKLTTPEAGMFNRITKYLGYNNFKHFVNESSKFNHRVVRIEKGDIQDTGTLTIDKEEKYHNYHTFALSHCFIRNSEDFFFAQRADGRGSTVDTLPGGQGLGELADLEYFQKKVWRGLRIPTSYMTEGAEGAIFNDGKVGTAYIQELRFCLYIMRLQCAVEAILDMEFKNYLRRSNIHIDEELYRIRLPEPSNFGTFRQQETDAALLNTFGSADSIPYLSKRFILSRYLQLEDGEIILNERMRREELGMNPDGTNKEDLNVIYGQGAEEAAAAAAGGGGLAPMTAAGAPSELGGAGTEGGLEPAGTGGVEGGAQPPAGGAPTQ